MARFLTTTFLILLTASQSFAQLVLTMGGDVNFNKNLRQSNPQGFMVAPAQIIPWDSYTDGIKNLIDGDLNFANIETVISDRRDMNAGDKKFVFVTHPNAIEQLIKVRFNLFNLANNHAYDYGSEGIKETIANMARLKEKFPHIVSFGLGYKNDLLQPKIIRMKGYTIAFASLSILDPAFKASDSKPGMIHINSREDYYEIMKNMKAADAQYKIVSIHNGTEGQVTLDSGQKEYYEYAIKSGDVDLVIGHHPHSVRPVEKLNGKYIFYSLGNYLMLGSANITGLQGGKDFGLFSRLHLQLNTRTNRLEPEAIELIPLTDTHASVRPMPATTGTLRLEALKVLAKQQLGSVALEFQTKTSGTGLYCSDTVMSERAKELCKP